MLRHLHRSTGGPIGRPHFEDSRMRPGAHLRSARVLLAVALAVSLAVGLAFIGATVSVQSAESEVVPGTAAGFVALTDLLLASPASLDPSTALFTLLVGLGAVAILMLRPRLPVKGRERDR